MSKRLKIDQPIKSLNFCIPPPHTPPPPMTETCVFRNLGVWPRSSERENGFSRYRERRRAEADEEHGPGWTPYTENIRYWRHARGVPPVRVSR